jgi:hypothetical protein
MTEPMTRGSFCAESGYLDARGKCRSPDGCFCDTLLATMTELEQVKGERRNIVSHATMGGTDGEGMSVNAISVKITALRNELYQEAKAQVTAAETALAAMTEREGVLREAATLAMSDLEMAFKPHTSMVELIRLGTGACLRLSAALRANATDASEGER